MDARRWGFALVCCGAACSFDSSGVGTSAATVPGGDSTSGAASATDNPSSTGADTPPGSTVVDGSGEGNDGPAMLVLVDAPMFDFAEVALGAVETHAFVLRNEGTGPALGLDAEVIGMPFSLAGGPFPGEGGTCGDALAAAGSCVFIVACVPTVWGDVEGSVVVRYDDAGGGGSLDAQVRARGIGETPNLLVNGDAEQGGMPPVGWELIDNGGNNWQASVEFAFGGAMAIWAGQGQAISQFRLRQPVAVEEWADLIDAGEVSFRVRAHTRSFEQGNDAHAVRLRFMGGGGELISEVTSPSHAGSNWQPVDESALAPTGTRTVQVQLRCDKADGDFCDGFFDDVSLVASHP